MIHVRIKDWHPSIRFLTTPLIEVKKLSKQWQERNSYAGFDRLDGFSQVSEVLI